MPTLPQQEALPHGEPRRFRIAFAQHDIDELRTKLQTVRWGAPGGILPEDDPKADAGLLPTPETLKSYVKEWQAFDFRKAETELNRYDHFTVDIGWCTPLHYVHRRSSRGDAIPLIIVHGWPGSFVEFLRVADKLAEPERPEDPAFHVVIPSLPGYAFSKGPPSKTAGTGDVDGYCRVLDTLMISVLEYKAYASQGGDWGSGLARCLGAKFARPDGQSGCRAVHLNFAPLVPPGGWTLIALPDRLLASLINYLPGDLGPNLRKMLAYARSMAYYYVHQQRPQQLAPAILDSPVGLLAWLSFFWGQHIGTSPTFTTDVMLTACTIYYFTECFGTSMLPYHNNVLLTEIHGGSAYRVQDGVTLGYSDFPNEIINMSRSWLTWSGDLRFYAKATRGGHFAGLEAPDVFAEHLRVAFAAPLDHASAARTAQSSVWTWFWPLAQARQQTRAHTLGEKELLKRGIKLCSITGSLWTPSLPTGGAKSLVERKNA